MFGDVEQMPRYLHLMAPVDPEAKRRLAAPFSYTPPVPDFRIIEIATESLPHTTAASETDVFRDRPTGGFVRTSAPFFDLHTHEEKTRIIIEALCARLPVELVAIIAEESLKNSYCKASGSGIFASNPKGFAIQSWQSMGRLYMALEPVLRKILSMPMEGKEIWGVAVKIVLFVKMRKGAEQQADDKSDACDEEAKWEPWEEREDGEQAPDVYNRMEVMASNTSSVSFLFSNAIQLGDRFEGPRPSPLNPDGPMDEQQPVKAEVILTIQAHSRNHRSERVTIPQELTSHWYPGVNERVIFLRRYGDCWWREGFLVDMFMASNVSVWVEEGAVDDGVEVKMSSLSLGLYKEF